jgi:hypothetical protein
MVLTLINTKWYNYNTGSEIYKFFLRRNDIEKVILVVLLTALFIFPIVVLKILERRK